MTDPTPASVRKSPQRSEPIRLATGFEHGVFYLSLVTVIGAGLSALVGWLASQPTWLPSLLTAWLVCGVAAVLAWVVIALPDRLKPGVGVPLMAPILATTIRLMASIAGIAIVLGITPLPRLPMILTALAAYLTLMAAEAYLLYLTRPAAGEAGPS